MGPLALADLLAWTPAWPSWRSCTGTWATTSTRPCPLLRKMVRPAGWAEKPAAGSTLTRRESKWRLRSRWKAPFALVTIDREQQLNALNAETLLQLEKEFTAAKGDRGIKVVVVTGAGKKAFVAGADILR